MKPLGGIRDNLEKGIVTYKSVIEKYNLFGNVSYVDFKWAKRSLTELPNCRSGKNSAVLGLLHSLMAFFNAKRRQKHQHHRKW